MEIDINNLHHAYLLEGAPLLGERFLVSLFKQIGFEPTGNPDYFVFENESFLVDDARLLKTRAVNKAFGERKIFVIKNARPNLAAQNALLKTFEDPVPNTHFFILLPERDLLLPTLLSRLEIIRINGKSEESLEVENFLTLSSKDRLDFVKKFVDKEKLLAPFLDSLLILLKKKGAENEEIKKVFNLRKFADDQSVMPRFILEHLSLVLK